MSWVWVALLISGIARGGPFTQKTSQGALAETQVDRRLVMPKGWLELGLSGDTKTSGAYRNAAGKRIDYKNETRWHYSRLWFTVRQGFSKRITLYGRIPWIWTSLEPALGNAVRTAAMGDAHAGVIVAPWALKNADIGFQLDLKAPSGLEWPSGTAGGADGIEGFLTGTGATNLGAFVHGKYAAASVFGMQGQVGYVRKFPAIVGYVVQTDGFGNGWLNPADEFVLAGALTGQMGTHVALQAGVDMRHRGRYRMGVSGETVSGRVMSELPGDPATFVDGVVTLSVEPTDHWEITTHAKRDLAGGDTRTFAQLGLEEFSPQPGLELGLGVACRW